MDKFEYEMIKMEKANLEIRLQKTETLLKKLSSENRRIIEYAEYLAEHLDPVYGDWIDRKWSEFNSKF